MRPSRRIGDLTRPDGASDLRTKDETRILKSWGHHNRVPSLHGTVQGFRRPDQSEASSTFRGWAVRLSAGISLRRVSAALANPGSSSIDIERVLPRRRSRVTRSLRTRTRPPSNVRREDPGRVSGHRRRTGFTVSVRTRNPAFVFAPARPGLPPSFRANATFEAWRETMSDPNLRNFAQWL
jgi:hypothetical protein